MITEEAGPCVGTDHINSGKLTVKDFASRFIKPLTAQNCSLEGIFTPQKSAHAPNQGFCNNILLRVNNR